MGPAERVGGGGPPGGVGDIHTSNGHPRTSSSSFCVRVAGVEGRAGSQERASIVDAIRFVVVCIVLPMRCLLSVMHSMARFGLASRSDLK